MNRRRPAALVLLLVALAVGASLAPPTPAGAQGAPPVGNARVTLLQQPLAVSPTDTFTAFVAVTGAPDQSDLAIDIYPRVESAAGLDAATAGRPQGTPATFVDPILLPDEDVDGVRQAAFTIDLYTEADEQPATEFRWQLDEPGVYPIGIRLRGPANPLLSTFVTTVIRLPESGQEVDAAQVALLETVHRDPPADAEARRATDRIDPGLLSELTPVLDALDEHPTLPATFAVTPDTAVRLAGDPSGSEVLDALQSVLAQDDRELLDAPYVDVDPASLVDQGLASGLSRQRDLGRRALTDVLEAPSRGTWSLTRPVDRAALDQLRARGIGEFVLPATAFAGRVPSNPVALDAEGGPVQALVRDPRFVLAPGDDPVLSAHRFLARLVTAALSSPTAPALVVDLAPGLDPITLDLVFGALAEGSPFLTATTVGDLLADPDAAQPAPPLAARVPQDLGSYPVEAKATERNLASYASMVADDPDLLTQFERPLALSAAVDLTPDERTADLGNVQATLDREFAAISVPAEDKVTLGTRNAQFPLPISSTLAYPVTVVVDLESNDRLEFPEERVQITLDGERTLTDVRVRAKVTGDTPVRITIRSADGRVVLAESRYTIRSTAVSGVGLLLTVGAAAFLALWWGRHWLRSRRTPRHARPRSRRPSTTTS